MLERLAGTPRLTVEIMSQPSPVWWDCYARADAVEPASVTARKAICAQITQATAYAVVVRGDEAIAVGSAVAEAGWVGFFNVATVAKHRRIGAAQAVMLGLGMWGQRMGANHAYLQVMAGNPAAWKLYARLGFVTEYYYHYREEAHYQEEVR
jgi:GNAT superfamily N-acetyltransferase